MDRWHNMENTSFEWEEISRSNWVFSFKLWRVSQFCFSVLFLYFAETSLRKLSRCRFILNFPPEIHPILLLDQILTYFTAARTLIKRNLGKQSKNSCRAGQKVLFTLAFGTCPRARDLLTWTRQLSKLKVHLSSTTTVFFIN